ncbi:MAG: hypothetical protein U0790_17305 [Isosphaeraceae bacterium]
MPPTTSPTRSRSRSRDARTKTKRPAATPTSTVGSSVRAAAMSIFRIMRYREAPLVIPIVSVATPVAIECPMGSPRMKLKNGWNRTDPEKPEALAVIATVIAKGKTYQWLQSMEPAKRS